MATDPRCGLRAPRQPGPARSDPALQPELCLPRLLPSPAPVGLDRWTSGFRPESWPQGQTTEPTPFAPPQRFRRNATSLRVLVSQEVESLNGLVPGCVR